jgi:7,8-dihydropterin-6-yl-methyl-4-(beta-D-ribofuranosyl)aminobenzene 5'-phosphate synthase
LKKVFGDRYLYAGLGTTLPVRANSGSDMRRGEGPALQQDDLADYRRLARREDPFGVLRARSVRKASQL